MRLKDDMGIVPVNVIIVNAARYSESVKVHLLCHAKILLILPQPSKEKS